MIQQMDSLISIVWQFDIWFLCLFSTQLVHLEVLSLHTTES